MDEQQLQAKIAEAKAAGYTDEEIQSHLDEMRGIQKPLEAPEQNKHHEANVGTAQAGAAALGGPAADLAIKGAEIAGAGYGLKKLAVDPIIRAVQQANPNATQRGPNGQVFRGGVPGANNPVPPSQGFTGGANPAWDEALAKPHPSAPPEPPTAANFIQRVTQLAGRYAPVARGAAGVAAAVTPGNVGQNYGAHFPQAGPLRGSEINPQTGRPWTEFELARYNQQY